MSVPKLEATLGMEVYATQALGIEGKIRCLPEDFIVEEILVDGSRASVHPEEVSLPPIRRRYLVCVLIKRRWDTMLAIKMIARQMGISSDDIHIAGLKDTRALTAQHVSIGGVSPERISKVSIKGITIRPISFSDEHISSKILLGNHFNILIRSIVHDPSTLKERIDEIRCELSALGGVPNYFGHQRFGTVRPLTHIIGQYILKGDLEDAALSFLSTPSFQEHPESMEARRLLSSTQDYKSALKYFPGRLVYERLMLNHLGRYPKDFLGAFKKLPPRLRKLFVQAYQSYLFNRFLSERMRRRLHLDEAEIGDYVIALDEMGLPTNNFLNAEENNLSRLNKAISQGRMGVAIPLIGFRQGPSKGDQGEIERKILEEEGISPEDFLIKAMPEASAPGGLRKILASILDLHVEEETDPSGLSNLNVRLKFTLHKSSYATVLLREFMKPKDLIKAGF